MPAPMSTVCSSSASGASNACVDALRDRRARAPASPCAQQHARTRRRPGARPGRRRAPSCCVRRSATLHQQQVAEAVAEHVVDVLEAVEVEHHDRDRACRRRRAPARSRRAPRRGTARGSAGRSGCPSRRACRICAWFSATLMRIRSNALRQVADLVVARAGRASASRSRRAPSRSAASASAAQRRGHAARGEDAAEREHDDAEQRDAEQRRAAGRAAGAPPRRPRARPARARRRRRRPLAADAEARAPRTPSSSPPSATGVIAASPVSSSQELVCAGRRRARRRGWSGSPRHGVAPRTRATAASGRAPTARCMSATSWSSSGKPISTQPTTSGAFTGTSTDLVRPAARAARSRWPGRTPPPGPPAARPAATQVARLRGSLDARRLKSVPSSATSVAPMRAPWLASTETMVSASFEAHRLAEAVVGGEQARAVDQRLGACGRAGSAAAARRPRSLSGSTRCACSARLARIAMKLATCTASSRPRKQDDDRAPIERLPRSGRGRLIGARARRLLSAARCSTSALPTVSAHRGRRRAFGAAPSARPAAGSCRAARRRSGPGRRRRCARTTACRRRPPRRPSGRGCCSRARRCRACRTRPARSARRRRASARRS